MSMASTSYTSHLLLILISLSFFSTISSFGSIHELLQIQGLPGGLFPKNVKSYILHQNMVLEVFFESPCVAKFETLVSFDSVVRANLSYGRLLDVQGLSDKELFIWLPVREIIVKDPNSGVITFDIALANKTLAVSSFEKPPFCQPIAKVSSAKKGGSRKEMGFGFLRVFSS